MASASNVMLAGRWFHHLGHHVRQTHNLTADEYRALFGLNVRTGLVGPELAAGMRARAVRLDQYHAVSAAVLRSFTPEQMSAYQCGRSRRLETRIKPRNIALRQLALDKAQTRVAELRAAGVVLYRPTHEEGVAWGHRVQERLRIHRQDPEFDAAWRRAISEGRGGKATLNCAICGAPFQVQPSRAKERKLCSKACRSEFCRRQLALVRERPGGPREGGGNATRQPRISGPDECHECRAGGCQRCPPGWDRRCVLRHLRSTLCNETVDRPHPQDLQRCVLPRTAESKCAEECVGAALNSPGGVTTPSRR